MRHLQRPLLEPPIWQALSEQNPPRSATRKTDRHKIPKGFHNRKLQTNCKSSEGAEWNAVAGGHLRRIEGSRPNAILRCSYISEETPRKTRRGTSADRATQPWNHGHWRQTCCRAPATAQTYAPAAESAAAEPVAADPAAADPAAFVAKPAGVKPAVPAAEPAAPLSNLPLSQRHQLRSTP